MAMSCSVLSLGTRMDARYWYAQCQRRLSFQPGVRVTTPRPSLRAMESVFARKDDWLYLAGHFRDHLYNHDDTSGVTFSSDQVELRNGKETRVLKRGEGFNQYGKLKVLFWGGCNVHSDANTVRAMRALFGAPVMVGWHSLTNRFIMLIVMGGLGNKPPNPARDFFDRIKADPSDLENIRNAWLESGFAAHWGKPKSGPPYQERFSVVDRDGQEYILGTEGIKKGQSFG